MPGTSHSYRGAIIGCGRIAALHAEPYDMVTNVELIAAADIDYAKCQAFADRWEIPQRYSDYEEMLRQEEIDVVHVCTMDNLHGAATIAAAEAGARLVICEKPMAFNLEEADRMVATCERTGTKLVVDHSMRFEANYLRVKSMIDEGVIGELRSVSSSVLSSRPANPTSWHSQYQFAGGGPLMHNGTHIFDLVRYYAGEAEWVFAHVERGQRDVTIEDMAAGVFGLSNGVHFFFESGGRRKYSTFEIILEGTEGRVAIAHGSRNVLDTSLGGSWEPDIALWRRGSEPFAWQIVPTEKDNPWVNILADSLACVEQDRESRSSGREARAALEMIMAVYESQRQGGAKIVLPLSVRENPFEMMLATGEI
jgi:UDP-N-acetyl-2-amino-2-deoxyglucuronate dehydrogenase